MRTLSLQITPLCCSDILFHCLLLLLLLCHCHHHRDKNHLKFPMAAQFHHAVPWQPRDLIIESATLASLSSGPLTSPVSTLPLFGPIQKPRRSRGGADSDHDETDSFEAGAWSGPLDDRDLHIIVGNPVNVLGKFIKEGLEEGEHLPQPLRPDDRTYRSILIKGDTLKQWLQAAQSGSFSTQQPKRDTGKPQRNKSRPAADGSQRSSHAPKHSRPQAQEQRYNKRTEGQRPGGKGGKGKWQPNSAQPRRHSQRQSAPLE